MTSHPTAGTSGSGERALPDPPRSPLIDPLTGGLTREWARFFDDLRRAIVRSLDDSVGTRLDQLEADAAFGDGARSGGAAPYPDAEIRARLELLELESALSGPGSGQDRTALALLSAQIEALTAELTANALELAMVPDVTAAVTALRRQVRALEVAQVMAGPDEAATVRTLRRRMADLELLTAFD